MLKRKQQILTKIETVEGTPESLSSGDAVLVYDPEAPKDDVNFLSRVPAGPTLSRQNTPPGLTTRALTFKEDFRGSGAIATAPSFGRHLRTCAHREIGLVRLTLTGMSSTERIQVGELVQQGSTAIRGMCLTDLSGVNGDIVVMMIAGTFTATSTLTGESGAASATIGAVSSTNEGFGYVPDSARLVQWNSGAWSASTPSGTGVVLDIQRGGFVVGSVQVTALGTGSSWVAGVQGQLLWGSMLNADVLTDGTNSATLSANPTQIRMPSLTIGANLDGFNRVLSGVRGNFTLEGSGGEPLVFSYEWRGRAASHGSALQLATSGLSTIRAPRLFQAFCGIGYGSQFYRMPVKSIQLTPANTIGNRLDANAAGGLQGTQVTDRDPTITIEVDQLGMGFDWLTRRNLEQNVRFGAVLGGDGSGSWAGRTAANTMVLAAANCQVVEVSDGDQDGFATVQVTLRPRSIQESGDDEYCLAGY